MTFNITNCHHNLDGALEGNRSHPLAGYGTTQAEQSVYSPHGVIALVRSFGVCVGCTREAELVNNYCEACRVRCHVPLYPFTTRRGNPAGWCKRCRCYVYSSGRIDKTLEDKTIEDMTHDHGKRTQ